MYSRLCAAELRSFSVKAIPKRCKIFGTELYGNRPVASVSVKISIEENIWLDKRNWILIKTNDLIDESLISQGQQQQQ